MISFKQFLYSITGVIFLLGVMIVANPLGTDVATPSDDDDVEKVKVVNKARRPALVRNVDNPAFDPFQAEITVMIPEGETEVMPTVALDPLPDGKRLVIEHLSAITPTPLPPQVGVGVAITTILDGDSVRHSGCVLRPLVQTGAITPSNNRAICSQPVRYYADEVIVGGLRPASVPDPLTINVKISGHLVDVG